MEPSVQIPAAEIPYLSRSNTTAIRLFISRKIRQGHKEPGFSVRKFDVIHFPVFSKPLFRTEFEHAGTGQRQFSRHPENKFDPLAKPGMDKGIQI